MIVNCLKIDNLDIGAAGPYLSGLLTIPSPPKNIVTRRKVVWYLRKIMVMNAILHH